LLDFVLWAFIALDWESVTIPADFAATHQPEFIFPYSHGLPAAIAWSVVAAVIAGLRFEYLDAARWRAAALVGAAVFSHWLLDALVHRPELPLAGYTSDKVGLALWNSMPLALGVEAAVVLLGLRLFLRGSALTRGRRAAIAVSTVVILVFTAVGMTVAPPPPSATAMAGTSLVTLALTCAVFGWLGRAPSRRRASAGG
jgi:hypothetical protein